LLYSSEQLKKEQYKSLSNHISELYRNKGLKEMNAMIKQAAKNEMFDDNVTMSKTMTIRNIAEL
jgi:hypothetical protein